MEAMKTLEYCLVHLSFPLPIVLLNATVTRILERGTAEAHGLPNDIEVLRERTVRLNLCFAVLQANGNIGERSDDAVIRRKMKQNLKTLFIQLRNR